MSPQDLHLACVVGLSIVGIAALLGTMFAAVGASFRDDQRR